MEVAKIRFAVLERWVLTGAVAIAVLETAVVATSVDSPKHNPSGLHSLDVLRSGKTTEENASRRIGRVNRNGHSGE